MKTIDVTADPYQYGYRQNRSAADAISSVVHLALTRLDFLHLSHTTNIDRQTETTWIELIFMQLGSELFNK